MDMTFRVATPAEQIYGYAQSKHINEQCGNIGRMWGTPNDAGEVAFNPWESSFSEYNTPEFNVEFKSVLEMLYLDERCGCALKNRDTMVTYCLDYSEVRFKDSQDVLLVSSGLRIGDYGRTEAMRHVLAISFSLTGTAEMVRMAPPTMWVS